jgi:hypothetical protein
MNTNEGAREILKRIEATYVPTHRYQTVDEKDFRHLDLGFYGKTQAWLEQKGFRFLCDKEDLTISEAPGNVFHRTMIRVMVSSDDKIATALYHPKIKPLWLRILLFVLGKRLGRIVDFETEFADGSFVCTSNALVASALSLPKQIDVEYHPAKTAIGALLERHLVRITEHAKNCKTPARSHRTNDDVVAMQNRMNALKAAYRGEIGGITKEELDRLSPNRPELTNEVYAEISKLNEEKKNQ